MGPSNRPWASAWRALRSSRPTRGRRRGARPGSWTRARAAASTRGSRAWCAAATGSRWRWGEIEPAGQGYLLRAWALDPVTDQRLAEAERRVSTKAEVLQAADLMAAELRRGLGERRPAGAQSLAGETFTTGSLDAMNSYARAQELQYQGQYAGPWPSTRKP